MSEAISVSGQSETAPFVLALKGELDIAHRDTLNTHIDTALATNPPALIIDVAAVTFMDSTVLNALVRAHRLCRDQHIPLIVRSPSARTQQLFKITGTDHLFLIDAGVSGID
jgi:anti-sigma B factor antagonist